MPSLEVGNQGCEESQRELQETRERFRWKAQRAERRGKEAGLTHLRGRGSSGARTLGNKFATAGGAGVGSKDLTGLAKEFEVWIHFLSLQTQVGPNVAAEHNTRLVSVPEARSSVGLPGISAPSVRGRNERAGGGRVPFWRGGIHFPSSPRRWAECSPGWGAEACGPGCIQLISVPSLAAGLSFPASAGFPHCSSSKPAAWDPVLLLV